MTAVAIQYRDEIIAEVSKGNRLTDVIRNLGLTVTPQALSKVLTSDQDYAAAIHVGTVARLDEAEKDIKSAREQVDVSRASAYHRAISWRAEREVPDRYGIKGDQWSALAVALTAEGKPLAAPLFHQPIFIGVDLASGPDQTLYREPDKPF